MKIAQEIRAGNVIMVGKDPMVVLKAEFSKSGRNACARRTSASTTGARSVPKWVSDTCSTRITGARPRVPQPGS